MVVDVFVDTIFVDGLFVVSSQSLQRPQPSLKPHWEALPRLSQIHIGVFVCFQRDHFSLANWCVCVFGHFFFKRKKLLMPTGDNSANLSEIHISGGVFST